MVISDKQKKKKKHPLTVHGRTGLLSTSGHPGEGWVKVGVPDGHS